MHEGQGRDREHTRVPPRQVRDRTGLTRFSTAAPPVQRAWKRGVSIWVAHPYWVAMTSSGDDLTFVCPGCGESLAVNVAMKEALIDNGCVICGTDVSSGAFSEC